jgi:hypothetical protein
MKITGKEAIIALLDGKKLRHHDDRIYSIKNGKLYVLKDKPHEDVYSELYFNAFIGLEFEIVEEKDNKQLLQEASNILAEVVMNNPINSGTTLVAKRLINILSKIEL